MYSESSCIAPIFIAVLAPVFRFRAKKIGDTEGLKEASVTLKQRQQALKGYCNDAGLSYKSDRTAVVGYNKSVSAKVSASAKKATNEFYNDMEKVLGKKSLPSVDDFQKMRYNKTDEYKALKATYSEAVTNSDFSDIQHLVGKKSDYNVRKWYVSHDRNLPDLIDKSQTIEKQARQACDLRNQYRTQARDLMKDQVKRKRLDITDPNRTFDELLQNKKNKYGMTQEEAIKDILRSASSSRTTVNKKYGLE